MDKAAQAELDTIVDAIKNTVNAEDIYLFGSYAYGTPNKDSDFDIYVILGDDSMRPIIAMQELYMAVSRCNVRSIDFLANTREKFEERVNSRTIERTVFRNGVKLYGRHQNSQTMV